ncbi:RagB/SusD family nutrient uptake outer membrane protein [Parapedobacter sp. DT-150]|uniref:RagB/SusD family nutrient uptake outer membrane protein n=1 Tax=Parapedobacter sp. DT-150 TaxID=3396162 RepID=UPI003F1DC01A
MKKIKIAFFIGFAILSSCNSYLDVVPDNIATIDYAFNLRSSAERFLFTCYSYMPDNGHFNTNPGFFTADEVWNPNPSIDISQDFYSIALGLQNEASPFGDYWTGVRSGRPMFTAIRDCNIFLDNIHKVEELQEFERQRWIAEVQFLKAYYHFILFREYGPIPLIKANLPISAGPDEVQVKRQPVDEVVDYIVELLDEAAANVNLPDRVLGTENSELGRVTRAMVFALKAKVLVTAASPLYNGNSEYASFRNKDGIELFNPNPDPSKWERAAQACKEAIDFCHANNFALHTFFGNPGYVINDTIQVELDYRTALTTKENSTEVIWANTNSRATDMQRWAMPLIAAGISGSGPKGILAPTLKAVERYYSANGVPITEDKTWDYSDKNGLRAATADERFYVKEGEQTVKLHFSREPRFYASVSFDRGIWFGNWVNNYNVNSLFAVQIRAGEIAARQGISNFSITGYGIKKLVNIETVAAADGNVTGGNQSPYPWPEFRLADLYLLYAEALNEISGYSEEATHWINLVRTRAGLPSVEYSWTNFSINPAKFQNKEGLREIIQQERAIELAFEGHRYWDLKRWKTAHIELNRPIKGWDITQKDAVSYYREVLLFNQKFTMREYLSPIPLSEMQINKNLVQNPGW